MAWLVVGPTFGKMLLVELWLSVLYAGYNGAMVVALTEIVPVKCGLSASPSLTA
jgi:MFS transporter, MHS family, citrate/tricarballylate:H+ symporter